MRRLLAILLGMSVAIAPGAVLAQSAASDPQAPAFDPEGLGVSLDRIHRRLVAHSRARAQGDSPLKLEYHVDVFGTAPPLRFFTGQDLVYGGIPGSAPTHSDMLYMFTPQEFRAPVVDFLGLAAGAAGVAAKKVQDWRYLRDLRAYQKLIESGRIVPAPPPRQ